MHDENQIPIWFFIGGLLLIYGILITAAGLYALVVPPPMETRVALYQFHADIWWGGLMTIVGALYCIKFRPWREPR